MRRSRAKTAKRMTGPAPDPRIWGRTYRGPAPWIFGLLMVLLIAIGTYLAFAKQLPWSSPAYELHATFENTATLRPTSPVRIAGVNVGEVTNVSGNGGDLVDVTFSVDEDGLPIHADAEVEIRPRLFLEGNFFLDLKPGSPSAPELSDGDSIPVTQTSTAVQLDEVLSALQAPTRKGLQKTLTGFGTALNYQPTAQADRTQDPDVAGETRGRVAQRCVQVRRARRAAARRSSRRPCAARTRAISPGSSSPPATCSRSWPAASSDLGDLITNFNTVAGRARRRVGEPVGHDRRAAADARDGASPRSPTSTTRCRRCARWRSSRARGSRSCPTRSRPSTRGSTQTGQLVKASELGGLARLLKGTAPGLAQVNAGAKKLFPQVTALSRCSTKNLVPSADTTITADDPVRHRPAELL